MCGPSPAACQLPNVLLTPPRALLLQSLDSKGIAGYLEHMQSAFLEGDHLLVKLLAWDAPSAASRSAVFKKRMGVSSSAPSAEDEGAMLACCGRGQPM